MSVDNHFAGLLGPWPPTGLLPQPDPAQAQPQGLLPAQPAAQPTMGLLDVPGDPASLFPPFNATDLAGSGQAGNDLGLFAAQVSALQTIRDQLGDPLGWFASPAGQTGSSSARGAGPVPVQPPSPAAPTGNAQPMAARPPSPPAAMPSAAPSLSTPAGGVDPQTAGDTQSPAPLKGYSPDQINQAMSLDPDIASGMQAENSRVLQAARPAALAIISRASNSGNIDAFQQADLDRVNSLLSSNRVGVAFTPVPGEAGADGAALMDKGVGTIDIDPAYVIRPDGSVDYNALASYLVHEGRHEYDDYALGLLENNGPQNVNEERWAEQNAWRAQAALAQATGHGDAFKDANGKAEALLTGTADDAAEASLKIWLDAARKLGLNLPLYSGQGGAPGQ